MCSKGTFECQRILECIDEDRKCDGEPDCRDMTDEKYCKSYTTVCLSVYLSVPSSVCLSVSLCPSLSLSLIKGTSKNLYHQRHEQKIVIKPYRSVPLDDSPSTNIKTIWCTNGRWDTDRNDILLLFSCSENPPKFREYRIDTGKRKSIQL